ncbi:hypothetical protein [Paraburkholderia fynbosensis]|uniref:hypothetical protein n=1 Tax=Paraburkholderia fynbosensis TaxID=1200993 RepID=UPI001FECEFF0|nr:hypothetical protein [Paraburkholderia fynbosensis]
MSEAFAMRRAVCATAIVIGAAAAASVLLLTLAGCSNDMACRRQDRRFVLCAQEKL